MTIHARPGPARACVFDGVPIRVSYKAKRKTTMEERRIRPKAVDPNADAGFEVIEDDDRFETREYDLSKDDSED